MSDHAPQFETPEDAGAGEAGEVRLWGEAIALARTTEEKWRKRADEAVMRYRDDVDEAKRPVRRFNILYANTQVLLPAIYNSTPVPDIRRRFGDADEVGKVAAQVLERAVSYHTDIYDFDGVMRAMCWDAVVVGRGVARIAYEPTLTEQDGQEQISDEAVMCRFVDWRDFIVGPGRRWDEVPWIAFEHRLTREELARFGPIGETMPLDVVCDNAQKPDARDVPEVFKRGTVYEIWDKQRREVKFLAKSVPDRFLKREPDPLKLRDFWPMPRPVYDVPQAGSLVPIVPFDLYRDQAEELDRVTQRITALVNMLRYRGLRAADLPEMHDLADARDGEFAPVQNWQQFMGTTGGGGLEKAIWHQPIDVLVGVLRELVVHREEIKRVIYEVTGLSDILRGASEENETATAQRLKSQWGSLRVQDRQSEVQRFARDMIRLKCEIIAERFQPQTLAIMTGTELPPDRMTRDALAQAGQMEPDAPTWEDVLGVLRSDAMRAYRVDIETDSTVQADATRMQQSAGEFVQGFGGFIQAVGPAVVQGFMPMDVAADLLKGFARHFKLGRQAEDAIERLGKAPPTPPQQQGDPAAAQQAQMQVEAQKAEMEATLRREEMAQQGQLEQAKIAADMEKERMRLQAQGAIERERMAAERERHADEMQMERDKFAVEAALRANERAAVAMEAR